MGAGREESMDILPVGMADEFSEFLAEVTNKMRDMMEQANSLARKMDGKDDNAENQSINQLLEMMAVSARKIVQVVLDAAKDGVAKLEDKDKYVNSVYQKNCIFQIQDAMRTMFVDDYSECQLDNAAPETFTAEQKDEFESLLQETIEKWGECNDALCDKAESLANYKEKNELSDVCFKIADQIADVVKSLLDAITAAGRHLEYVNNERIENTEAINQAAEANMENEKQALMDSMKRIASQFDI